MNILDLITAILINKNYENKFNLPDGLIKSLFNFTHHFAPSILMLCTVVICYSFIKIYKSEVYDKNTGFILQIIVSTFFAAFCLSVSLNDLDFTIFKTIVPTVAGITALALFLQNDQKNRMELNDRHKEYRKSILIDRKNRHTDAIKTINTGGETNIQTGLRQLRSLLIEWLQDNPSNNYEKYEKRNEIINITDEVSAIFQENTKLKNKKSSSIEEAALSLANMVRGGWYIPPTTGQRKVPRLNFFIRYRLRLILHLLRSDPYETLSWNGWEQKNLHLKPKIIKYVQKIIDERLIAQDLSNNRQSSKYQDSGSFNAIIRKPTKFPVSQRLIFFHIGNSINENTYSFNFRKAKITSSIEFSGFQEVNFTKSNFHSPFIIKPDYQNTPDAYLIDTKFQGSTFHKPASFILTKFLFNSTKNPFSDVTFMGPTTFKSCVFLSGLPFPHDFIINKCDFQDRNHSLRIEDSLFHVPLSLKESSIPKVKLSNNYYTFATTITKVKLNQITFESCNLESLFINQIIRILGNIPEVKIKDSIVREKTMIRGDRSGSTLDINIQNSRFIKNSTFGDTRNYPANKVSISKSSFSKLEISADLEATIQNISVKKLGISVGTKSVLDISMRDIRRKTLNNMISKKVSKITIDGSYGQVRSLRLNDVHAKKISFIKMDFSQIENTEIENVKFKEIKFIDCTFDSPNQKEDIKRLAGTDSGYKKIKPKTHKELIENYEYFSNLEDLGL